MDESKYSEGTEKEARETLMYRSGPFKGKTCYIERVDRIRIQAEVGFRISAVVDFKLKNLQLEKQEDMRALYKKVKSCLVVMIGGHALIIDGVEEPWDGVYPALLFARCGNVPDGVESRELDGKTWMNLGDYLNMVAAGMDFEADEVRKDFLARR